MSKFLLLLALPRHCRAPLSGVLPGREHGRAAPSHVDITVINDIIDDMGSITIRGLGSDVKERLRVRAARHGRSMEEEARVIVREALAESSRIPTRLGDSIRKRFERLGVDLELPSRELIRDPPGKR